MHNVIHNSNTIITQEMPSVRVEAAVSTTADKAARDHVHKTAHRAEATARSCQQPACRAGVDYRRARHKQA